MQIILQVIKTQGAHSKPWLSGRVGQPRVRLGPGRELWGQTRAPGRTSKKELAWASPVLAGMGFLQQTAPEPPECLSSDEAPSPHHVLGSMLGSGQTWDPKPTTWGALQDLGLGVGPWASDSLSEPPSSALLAGHILSLQG